MDDRPVHGYEYDYRFSIDENNEVGIDIANNFHGFNLYEFEVRTNFILKKKEGGDGEMNIIMCSEDFRLRYAENYNESELGSHQLIDRLKEYWMLDHEIEELIREAMDFAEGSAMSNGGFVPMVMEIDVCTVQREGEGVDNALDRAIRVENFVPLHYYYFGSSKQDNYFIRHMPRTRVKDYGSGMMEEACSICLRESRIGDRISVLGACRHAFHYHCIVTWLTRSDTCPLCRCHFRKMEQGISVVAQVI